MPRTNQPLEGLCKNELYEAAFRPGHDATDYAPILINGNGAWRHFGFMAPAPYNVIDRREANLALEKLLSERENAGTVIARVWGKSKLDDYGPNGAWLANGTGVEPAAFKKFDMDFNESSSVLSSSNRQVAFARVMYQYREQLYVRFYSGNGKKQLCHLEPYRYKYAVSKDARRALEWKEKTEISTEIIQRLQPGDYVLIKSIQPGEWNFASPLINFCDWDNPILPSGKRFRTRYRFESNILHIDFLPLILLKSTEDYGQVAVGFMPNKDEDASSFFKEVWVQGGEKFLGHYANLEVISNETGRYILAKPAPAQPIERFAR